MRAAQVLEIIGPATAVKHAVSLISDRLRKFGVDRSVLPFFEFTVRHAQLPQRSISLPSSGPPSSISPLTVDSQLWVCILTTDQLAEQRRSFASHGAARLPCRE